MLPLVINKNTELEMGWSGGGHSPGGKEKGTREFEIPLGRGFGAQTGGWVPLSGGPGEGEWWGTLSKGWGLGENISSPFYPRGYVGVATWGKKCLWVKKYTSIIIY